MAGVCGDVPVEQGVSCWYETIESPLGALFAATTDIGLVRLVYERDERGRPGA